MRRWPTARSLSWPGREPLGQRTNLLPPIKAYRSQADDAIEDRVACLKTGMNGHVRKPVNAKRLAGAIAEAMGCAKRRLWRVRPRAARGFCCLMPAAWLT